MAPHGEVNSPLPCQIDPPPASANGLTLELRVAMIHFKRNPVYARNLMETKCLSEPVETEAARSKAAEREPREGPKVPLKPVLAGSGARARELP